MHRCGVAPDAALGLAMQAAALPGVRFAGVFGYEGHLLRAWPRTRGTPDPRGPWLAGRRGRHDPRRGDRGADRHCGGTGSYRYSAKVPGITELEAGGGCLMDLMYREDCHVGPETGLDFALTVRGMVVSRPTPDRAITDAGWKTMSNAHHVPQVKGVPGATVRSLSAEHGTLDVAPEADGSLRIGDTVEFIPGYHDSTVFLHDRIFGVRGGVVTEVIPVAARGRLS